MHTNRHITYFINDVKEINFCNNVFYELTGGRFEIPFDTDPTTGNHSLETCEGCQKQKIHLIKVVEGNFKKFPFCCERHSQLVKLKQFDKNNYNNIAESIANKILFTYHHIINHLDTENWRKEIKDYIDYTIESFGSFPDGYGEPFQLGNYFHFVVELLGNSTSFSSTLITQKELDTRFNYAINYLKNFTNKKTQTSKSDLNILLQTYDQWYKTFPFDLNSYFGNLKQHYEHKLPLLSERPETNKYSGITTAKLHTKDSLIAALINLTNTLLTQINGVKLFEEGLITNAKAIKLDLVVNSRKLKLTEGYKNDSKSPEQQYRKILKEWYKDEKTFIDELLSVLDDKPPLHTESNQLSQNPFEYVFADNLGYTLFEKMHQKFKDSNKPLANYSYVYYALFNDKFLVCSGVEFRDFLLKHYDICIDKIDSRQCGKNYRTDFYDAIKKSFDNKKAQK